MSISRIGLHSLYNAGRVVELNEVNETQQNWGLMTSGSGTSSYSTGDGNNGLDDLRYFQYLWTSSGNVTVTRSGVFEIFLIAGGGGAGRYENSPYPGGGGGGGGVYYKMGFYLPVGTYSFTIGGGGGTSTDGGNSSFVHPGGTIVCGGGGGGGGFQYTNAYQPGRAGSGGGGNGAGGGSGAAPGYGGQSGLSSTRYLYNGTDGNYGRGSNNTANKGGGGPFNSGASGASGAFIMRTVVGTNDR